MRCRSLDIIIELLILQAALGISQLKRADMGLARRQEIARRYREGLSDLKGVKLPFVSDHGLSCLSFIIIQVETD